MHTYIHKSVCIIHIHTLTHMCIFIYIYVYREIYMYIIHTHTWTSEVLVSAECHLLLHQPFSI